MGAQQANYAAIGNHLQGLANEIVLLPNAAVTLPQIQDLILQMQQNIQQQFQQLEDRLVARFDLIPLQFYNSMLPSLANLQYPPGVFQDFMPVSKVDLERLTVYRCQQTADALGLPALPPAALVADRRHQIQTFLGAI